MRRSWSTFNRIGIPSWLAHSDSFTTHCTCHPVPHTSIPSSHDIQSTISIRGLNPSASRLPTPYRPTNFHLLGRISSDGSEGSEVTNPRSCGNCTLTWSRTMTGNPWVSPLAPITADSFRVGNHDLPRGCWLFVVAEQKCHCNR